MVTIEKPLSPKKVAFVEAFIQTRNATQAALAAGYSKASARSRGCALLKDPRVRDLLQSMPPAELKLSPEAYYTREKAAQQYDIAFYGAIEDRKWLEAKEIVDAKVRLFGLAEEPAEGGSPSVQNNILNLVGDDELYDLLKRKREAGNGIDIDSIGHEVGVGVAKAKPQDHRQAEPTAAAGS